MNEKKFITKEQAVYILPDGNLIHTFYQLGSSLVGADWSREEIIEKIQKSDILELTGEIAKGMGHGLVAYDKDTERQSQILFIETNAERLEEVENGRNKEMNCKKCIHDPICQLWRDQEKQDASCYVEEACFMGVKEVLNWAKVSLENRKKELLKEKEELKREKKKLRKEEHPWGTR
ncbi:MAG TPA: hypothetical protein H9733_05000 [Candidatus Anaerotignum merdipullorum]|nr:hypothetical protein [Candidatus Anaerotignum merdipullorum]